ncbi:MAG: hypothetical protein J7577_22905 [Sphingobacteriaceae bacterium]|nr:hypothetical protein [Sphingobacteriaceae bacterium]
MTAIVGVLNSRAFTIAADSAVTVTGNNGKKVYNRSNKIFTLSKFHPVGIAIYNSADFLGIPLETAIKLYRQKLKEESFGTIEEYKNDFLVFLRSLVPGVSNEVKRDNFYGFCGNTYHPLISSLMVKINQFDQQGLDAAAIDIQYDQFVNEAITEQRTIIDGYNTSNYIQKTYDEFLASHQTQLTEIANYIQGKIVESLPTYVLKQASIDALHDLFYQMINVEWIFEAFSGLVFFGFGESEMYPATCQVLVGALICDVLRIREGDSTKIIPGQVNSNIIPYAQADVTETVLTGVDPNYKYTMKKSIEKSFSDVATGVGPLLADPGQQEAVRNFINGIGNELIQELNDYQFSAITGPLLDILAHMGKEDMAELAESLVNITSIKRKFTSSDSSDESVGGPVDVAVVTKGDGFIWIKRKHYFEMQNNIGFSEKYLKL